MYRTKKLSSLMPRSKPERALLTLLVLGIPCAAAWMWIVVLPEYPSALDSAFVLHVVLTVYLMYSVSINLFLTMRVDASGDASLLPTLLKPGWHFCHYCQHNTPPRAYHCHDCNTCILRQDHHCKFTGCCIGHQNQRFFIASVLHLLLGLSYMLVYQWPLVYHHVGVAPHIFPLVLLAPHFAWAWGTISHWGMVIATVHCAGIAAWIVCLWVTYRQICVVVTGATQYERKHDVKTYNVSLSYNVRMALGHRWYLVALWPHVTSVLPSDGLQFAVAGQHEEVKDM